ncbi:MAG TPA: ROK family protein [Methylocystis sp.]|nr:ROK family protein [Methylocystis sp.]
MIRVGVDLGGTKIEAIALSVDGEMLARRRIATPAEDYDAILRAVGAVVSAVEQEAGGRGAVGVGTPGAISPRTGLVKNSNTLALNGRPLAHDLALVLNRVVRLENDANCFALSEAVDGAGEGARVVFGVILGTGVGGGIVIDGKILRGHNRIAGEWGHNPLPRLRESEYPGPLCYCGEKGCIETFLCGPALARDFATRGGARLTAEEIARRADQGDARAKETLAAYRDRLARALASVVNVIDPDVIALGGGVSNVATLYEGLERQVERYAFTDALDTKILRNVHGDSGGVRGAAWLWGAREG